VNNLCGKFQLRVKQALTALGLDASTDYRLQQLNSDPYEGCSLVEVAQRTTQFPTPVRVFISAYLNMTTANYERLNAPTAYIQSQQFGLDASVICDSNLSWAAPISGPQQFFKTRVYAGFNFATPWLSNPAFCSPRVSIL